MSEELDTSEVLSDNETPIPESRWRGVARAAGALFAILLLLYLFGGSDFFFFRRTGKSVVQEPLAPVVAGEILVVPMSVFVFGGTERNADNVTRLVQNADAVWRQANISFQLSEVRFLPADDEERFAEDPLLYTRGIGTLSDGVTVFLTRTLRGINGIAFVHLSTIAVAEYTTSYDYRTFAHEIGHVLGLIHVADRSHLMSSGGFGVVITPDEAAAARRAAATLSTTEP